MTHLKRGRVALALPVLSVLILTACGGGAPRPQGELLGRVDTVQTKSIFSMPRIGFPQFGGGNSGGLPASEVQCRAELRKMGVAFTDIPRIYDNANCGVDYPVEVSSLARNVALKPAAKLNCQTALQMARWFQQDAAPAARLRYLSGVQEVRQLSSYSCRKINGSNNWSEHSKGNALDIGGFVLNNGREIDVAKPSFFAVREKGFLNSVRAAACDDFTTVLGPGSDRDHHDHFHFDLRQRSSGYRHCSL